ncbi:MAG: peptidoglycan-binding protein, partial [Firmicutes bacterium]|nr:peptidoglycan-binding protein [Bacillota bacterium]
LALFTAPSGTVTESYPGTPLTIGSTGANVRRMQLYLNRIAANYPAIPQIPPSEYGTFTQRTADAVRIFQRTFGLTQDGVIGRSTWNKISQIWVAITKIAELNGEGQHLGIGNTPPTVTIRQGSRGQNVIKAQYLLDFISNYFSEIPAPIQDSIFGATTADAVRAFQRRFGLTADGVVGPNTWNMLYNVYRSIQNQAPIPPEPPIIVPPVNPPLGVPAYPGFLIRRGQTGANVRTVQMMLNRANTWFSAVPRVVVDGVFGPATENSVRIFQRYAGLNVDGIVGPNTWRALANIRDV